MSRCGESLFRRSLALLPASLRERAGEEMLHVLRARQAEARGRLGAVQALAREMGGLLATAVRARLPSTWPRGKAPPADTLTLLTGEPMDRIVQDVRFAVRSLLRRPAGTAVILVTFSLGIAASSAMFSVVDTVLLRPLPFPDADRIVSVYPTNPGLRGHPTLGFAAERGSFSYPEYRDVRDGSAALAGIAPVGGSAGTVAGDDDAPERISVGLTTHEMFATVLRVTPLLGRTFTPEDEASDARVLLLTEGYWRRRFGGDRGVVGSTVSMEERPYTVIGILPAHARLAGYGYQAWAPLPPDENRGNHWLDAVGRLAPGATLERARHELATALEARAPADHPGHGINLFPRLQDETRAVRGPLLLLVAASALLLLVACGNVAAILLGVGIDRERELALRGALGAGRGRVLQQLLTESLVLAVAGAAGGILLAGLVTQGLVFLAPEGVPRIEEASLDGRVVAFATAVAVATGLLFGLFPALALSRTDLRRSLQAALRSTPGRARIQSAVVVGELALATVLLVGAGLLGRTLLALNRTDPGFQAEGVLSVRMGIPARRITTGLEGQEAREALDGYVQQLLDAVAALPGVDGVAMTSNLPLTPDRSNNEVSPEGYQGEEAIIAERRFVTADYLRVLGVPILEGRGLETADDRADAAPVVVVSEGLARSAWPAESAVGKELGYWGRTATVVGVAGNIRDEEMERGTELAFYAPQRQHGALSGSMVIRTSGDPAALAPSVRERIWSVDRGLPITSLLPMRQRVADALAAQRYRARLMVAFAALAGLFALMGIYGVTSRSVARRTREMGIRMALGAERGQVMGLVLAQALRLAGWGAALGMAASLLASRALESFLWGVRGTDLPTLAGTALMVAAASLLAALAPGRRAARVQPVEALRVE